MRVSEQGRNFITKLEGREAEVYRDVANLATIGVGHLLTKDELSSGKILILGIPIKYQDGLDEFAMDRLLTQDLAGVEGALNTGLTVGLSQHQFDALASFVFNVGRQAFMSSTLRKVINNWQFDQVAEQLKRWNISGGRVVQGLVKRREAEAALFDGGQY